MHAFAPEVVHSLTRFYVKTIGLSAYFSFFDAFYMSCPHSTDYEVPLKQICRYPVPFLEFTKTDICVYNRLENNISVYNRYFSTQTHSSGIRTVHNLNTGRYMHLVRQNQN